MAEAANPNGTMLEFQTIHFHWKEKNIKYLEVNNEPMFIHISIFLDNQMFDKIPK